VNGGCWRLPPRYTGRARSHRLRSRSTGRAVDGAAEVEGQALQFDLTGLDFRQLQNVVDESQEYVAAGLDDLGVALLFGGEFGSEEQLNHADHAVHGGADLMTHMAEKVGFCLCGL
jgi:hypothetical protein